MILKRKVIGITVLLLLVFAICLTGSFKEPYENAAVDFDIRTQIILDAGHAGFS